MDIKRNETDKLVKLYEGTHRHIETADRVLIAIVETDNGTVSRIVPEGSTAWGEERKLPETVDIVDHIAGLTDVYFLRDIW